MNHPGRRVVLILPDGGRLVFGRTDPGPPRIYVRMSQAPADWRHLTLDDGQWIQENLGAEVGEELMVRIYREEP